MANEQFNIEAEQSVLGSILVANDVLHKCHGLEAIHFSDPVHAEIFKECRALINEGKLASPVTLKYIFQDHPGMADLGGVGYLARLAGSASPMAAKDYAQTVKSLWARRDLVNAVSEAKERAESHAGGTVSEITGALEARLADNRNQGGSKPLARAFIHGVHRAVTELSDAYQGKSTPGRQTGLAAIDKFLGGFKPGRVYVLAGRPSMGKTAVGMNLAKRIACQGKGVIFASLEMPEVELTNRYLSQSLRERGQYVEYQRIENAWISEGEMGEIVEEAKAIADLPIWTITPENSDLIDLLSSIRSVARRFTDDNPLGMIVVDYLQLIGVKNQQNETAKIDAVSVAIKRISMELNVPVILLSQLNRAVETRDNKRPTLSDLRGSGSIEQDADAVIFCYRHAYYAEREMEGITDPVEKEDANQTVKAIENDLELIVAKHRGGKIGTIRLGIEIKYNHLFDKDEPMI